MNNFRVILNGCSINVLEVNRNIRHDYGIADDDFLLVFIGNVGPRKNQKQVVEAYSYLQLEEQQKLKVLFVGGGEDELLKSFIKYKGLQNNLIVCGSQPKKNIHNFYHAADATILTSLSEGFGLSVIEGMVYGLPCLMFADLPAVADLYDERAMVTIQTHSDKDVAAGIHTLMNKAWNKEWIKEYAKHFSFENMANNYDAFYKDIKEGRI